MHVELQGPASLQRRTYVLPRGLGSVMAPLASPSRKGRLLCYHMVLDIITPFVVCTTCFRPNHLDRLECAPYVTPALGL
jgi:hypothetical protein